MGMNCVHAFRTCILVGISEFRTPWRTLFLYMNFEDSLAKSFKGGSGGGVCPPRVFQGGSGGATPHQVSFIAGAD